MGQNIQELLQVGQQLGIHVTALDQQQAQHYIERVLARYKPDQTSNHLSIGDGALTLSLEQHEFNYSEMLEQESVYMFFDQEGMDRQQVVVIQDARLVGKLMENAFGMEYFLSNEQAEFLIAVNWYTMQAVGTAISYLARLK